MKNKTEKKKEQTFEARYKAYKSGELSDAPVLYKTLNIKVNEGDKKVILTAENIDRDGEVVELDGMKLPAHIIENGIPMIDSHSSHSSVTQNGLGAFRNPRVEMIKGVKSLVLDPDFAPTPNGKIAEILYMGVNGGKPYFSNVSMGFMVYDYDNETKRIKEWEPYEGSLVTVGANYNAMFIKKSANVEKQDQQIAKDLARFKQIHTPFKEFTKLFLSDKFCELVGYEKDGDMLIDINGIYDIVKNKFTAKVEAPTAEREDPELTLEQIQEALNNEFEKLLNQ